VIREENRLVIVQNHIYAFHHITSFLEKMKKKMISNNLTSQEV
jgi:hypothetical protein